MRTMTSVFSGTTFALLAFLQPAAAQDKAVIQKLDDQFAAAFNGGDYAAVAAIYSEDAAILPPSAEMMKGRQAIQTFWSKTGEAVGNAKLVAVDGTPLGNDTAREIGTFSLKTKGPSPVELTGKFVVVWRKIGTDWKLWTDIWNMDR